MHDRTITGPILTCLLLVAVACDSDDGSTGSTGESDGAASMEPEAGGGAGEGALPADPAGESDDAASDDGPQASEVYALDENWLCRPGAASEACQVPSATEVAPDNSLSDVSPAAGDTSLDCFYVYPTIATAMDQVGQVEDYANIDDIRFVANGQIGALSSVCEVYAPLYHQVYLGTCLDQRARGTWSSHTRRSRRPSTTTWPSITAAATSCWSATPRARTCCGV